METRYITVRIRRPRRGRKRRRTAAYGAAAGVSFLLMLGIAGGIEQDSIALGTGTWMMAGALITWALSMRLAGWMQ